MVVVVMMCYRGSMRYDSCTAPQSPRRPRDPNPFDEP